MTHPFFVHSAGVLLGVLTSVPNLLGVLRHEKPVFWFPKDGFFNDVFRVAERDVSFDVMRTSCVMFAFGK